MPHITHSKIRLAAGLALFSGTAAGAAYEIFCPKATFFGKVATHGPRKNHAVGIVFDQTPNPSTAAACRRLHELSVPATFFIEGKRARAFPRTTAPIQAFEIGIHGEVYKPLIFKKEQEIRRNLRPAIDLALDLQNKGARYFMPPYGFKDLGLIRTANAMGLTVINPARTLRIKPAPGGCNHIKRSIEEAVTRLLYNIKPGDIILIPWSQRYGTAEMIPDILTELLVGLKALGLSPWGLRALAG